jgi:HEXXH motif-containing protein
MAHQKLRVLGVSFESATSIVGNDPRNLYVSPIIKDRLRPMTAVLHAQYSYVHVTALDIRILEAEHDPCRCEAIGRRLGVNLARIKEGLETLRNHLDPGRHGEEFMRGMFAWTERTIGTGERLLQAKSCR